MAAGVLYTYPENFRAYKALIAAKLSDVDLKIANDFVFGVTNKSPAFLKKFPAGKVPAYESADGKVLLTESNAIAYYVSSAALRGATPEQAALVWQWCSWAESEVLPAAAGWVFPILGVMPPRNTDRARTDLIAALHLLDRHLLPRTFLLGDRLSLADIVVFCTLLHSFQHVLDPALRAELTNVTRWFCTVLHQPAVVAVLGPVSLCAAPAVLDPKKYAQLSQHKKEDGCKKEVKKEAKKEKKAEKKEAPREEEEEPKPQESKDPFDLLPKGTFNMDDFKRCYSNEDEATSIPYFWQKFDPQHYSIWFCSYRYPKELSKVFMSCNLITGMFQRLDKMRKQAFASVCLFGKDDDSTISGVWVWRGQELAFPLSPDWQIDYESYDWRKLEPSSAECKALLQQYFSWSGTDADKRPFNQGKIFK